jgi:hypothetical protein
MATYLNDLRLTELATGEGSGTWGTTTNLSLELIGEALGFATQQVFGSDADATTTIADGASDPARAMYFKITSAGSLTATRTCTIAPNTISRVMFIENATTGSQSIQISQGSGASVTILAGKTAVVYLDGAGSGAAVVDAMAGVDPGVTDTLAEVLAAGNTSGANNLIIDNGQAITTNTINETTAASGVTIDSVLLKDDGVNATNLEITNLKANDGTSAGSIADSTGVVTLASSVLTTADINGGTIDGTTLGATTPASVAATTGSFSSTLGVTGAATFSSTVAGAFNGTLGATTPASVAATTLSTTGAATFGGAVTLVGPDAYTRTLKITNGPSNPTYFAEFGYQNAAVNVASISVTDGGVQKEVATFSYTGAATFGGNVNVTGSSPTLTIASSDNLSIIAFTNSGGATKAGSILTDNTGTMFLRDTAFTFQNYDGTVEYARIDSSGNVGIGTSSPTYKLNVLSDAGAQNIFQAGQSGVSNGLSITSDGTNLTYSFLTGNVGIGTAAPESIVHIKDTGNVTTTLQIEGAATGYAPVINFDGIVAGNADYLLGEINGSWDTHTNVVSAIRFESGADTTNKDDGLISFWTSSSGPTLEERMRIDASGNLGLGVVPETWYVGGQLKALQIGGSVSLFNLFDTRTVLANNYYLKANGDDTYINTDEATQYYQESGAHVWFTAPSGTADTAITWSESMRIDASGNLLVGASSTGEAHILQSSGASKLTLSVTNANATTPYGQKINFSAAAPNDATYYFLTCADTSATRATIRSNGGLANYSANDANLSDEREKNQFGLLGSTTACLREWEIVKYLYKDEDQTLDPKYGVIAQQVAPHCPEVITDWVKVKGVDEVLWTDEDELPEGVAVGDVKTAAVQQVDRIGVKEQQMFWMLVKSHQEALDTIDALTARIEALEGAK